MNEDLFPSDIVLAAQHAERQTGFLSCLILGQGALESGFWKFTPPNSNNYFGQKWYIGCPYPYVTCYTKEYVNFQLVTVQARFIQYPTLETAFIDHGNLLLNPNGPYAGAIQFKNDWQKYIDAIGPIYATLPTYALNVSSIINQYQLYNWNLPQEPNPQSSSGGNTGGGAAS